MQTFIDRTKISLFGRIESSHKLIELGLILLSILEREMLLAQVSTLLLAVILAAVTGAPDVIIIDHHCYYCFGKSKHQNKPLIPCGRLPDPPRVPWCRSFSSRER